jgi:hypothetical protein
MKQGRSWNEVAKELSRQAETRRDFLAPASGMEVAYGEGKVTLRLDTEAPKLAIDETAHRQVAEAYGIPWPYYDRMRQDEPPLLVENVNHWLWRSEKTHLVRTLDRGVRAFLSARYRPLDNDALAAAVTPVLAEHGFDIESAEVTDSRLYIKAVSPLIEGQVRKGDIVRMAVSISNSEIGAGALRIDPMLFFLACTNGLIVAEDRLRKFHIGRDSGGLESAREFFRDETRQADDIAFWLKVRDALRAILAPERFHDRLKRLDEAARDSIAAEPLRVVEVTAKRFRLTDEEQGSVLTHFIRGHAGREELTRYGLAQALSRASQDVGSYDRATELERLSGSLIELTPTQWRPIAEARAE